MKRQFVLLLFAVPRAFAQAPPQPGTPAEPFLPNQQASLETRRQSQIQSVHEANSRSGFLKKLTFESFGYTLAPVERGFEYRADLLTGPLDSSALECPRCIIRSLINRTRYSLPAFGDQATLTIFRRHTQLFGGSGGINGWRADNTGLETGFLSLRRDSSFNDAWLLQFYAGMRVALDRGKHVWFGASIRHVDNFGSDGPRSWNTISINATFVF